MRIDTYELEELPKAQVLKNPEILYEKVKENPFVPYISNNVCIISTKFLREIMEAHKKTLGAKLVTDTMPESAYSFSRDYFIEEDWTPIA